MGGAVEEADEDLALVHVPYLLLRRRRHLDYDVGVAVDLLGARDDLRPGLLVVLVEVIVLAGPGLDYDLVALLDEPADGLGHDAHPPFALCYLLRHPYFHAISFSTPACYTMTLRLYILQYAARKTRRHNGGRPCGCAELGQPGRKGGHFVAERLSS